MSTQSAVANDRGCCENILQKHTNVPAACRQLITKESVEGIIAGKHANISPILREQNLRDFCQKVNALLNEGFGFVLVHFDNIHSMDLFNEKVNLLLDQMIADDSYFHDNFVWKHYDSSDEKHVLFWVKQRERTHISTLKVNTKVSWNGSLRDARQGQLRSHMKRVQEDEAKETDPSHSTVESSAGQPGSGQSGTGKYTFIQGEPVKSGMLAFQECIGLEAKSAPSPCPDLFDWLWRMENGGKLPGYITAFAKLEDGGSFFLGIAEEKKSGGSDQKTGRWICEGISLTSSERQELRQKITTNVRESMMWHLPEPSSDPVSVHFHTVQVKGKKSDTAEQTSTAVQTRSQASATIIVASYVMEVRVKPFHGIAFWHKDGPHAFTMRPREDPEQASPLRTTDCKAKTAATSSTTCSDPPPHRGPKRPSAGTASPTPKKRVRIPSGEPRAMTMSEWANAMRQEQ